nr:Replication-associated protein [Klebsiella pneumoniae]
MSNAHNPQHWSQLDTEEQIRFWQGVEDGHVASFLVSPEKKSTRRRRGEHSTKPKCENPTRFRPEHYKKLGGQLGHAYNRLVQKIAPLVRCDCVCTYRFIRCTSGNAVGMASGRKSNVCWMLSGQC